MTNDDPVLGIIAGSGRYPIVLLHRLLQRGIPVAVAGLSGQVNPADFDHSVDFKVFPIGQLASMAQFFRKNGVSNVHMAGGVRRADMWRHVSLDLQGLRLAPRALLGQDDSFLKGVARFFESRGILIVDPEPLMRDLLASPGLIAGPELEAVEQRQVRESASKARFRIPRSVGQAAVVFRGKVVAVEDRRGTDALIAEAPGPGAVLVKFARPAQDRRFDLPTVGPSTILAASMVGISVVVIEAGSVLIIDREKVCWLCAKKRVTLWAI